MLSRQIQIVSEQIDHVMAEVGRVGAQVSSESRQRTAELRSHMVEVGNVVVSRADELQGRVTGVQTKVLANTDAVSDLANKIDRVVTALEHAQASATDSARRQADAIAALGRQARTAIWIGVSALVLTVVVLALLVGK